MVMAKCGTFSSPRKSLAASWRVMRSSVMRRVSDSLARPWFVEADVACAANTQDLQVHAAHGVDGLLILAAVREHLITRHRTLGDMDVLLWNVDVVEQLVRHEPRVALGVIAVQASSIRPG